MEQMTSLNSRGTCLAALCFLATGWAAPLFAAEPEFHPSAKYVDMPFSAAVSHRGVVYLSGDIGTDEEGKLVPGGIGPESRQMMENIKATLQEHGLTMRDIMKCTVFLADIAQWSSFNEVYVSYFEPGRYPARSALGSSGLAMGARVEMECIAAAPGKR